MESARDKLTRKIVEAEDLRNIYKNLGTTEFHNSNWSKACTNSILKRLL